jgi:hypothetical protein
MDAKRIVGLRTGHASPERGSMGSGLLDFINVASLAVVIWAVVDVARRPVVALAPRWKALWIAGMVGGWFLFGIIGAVVSVCYLAGPRRKLNAGHYSSRY